MDLFKKILLAAGLGGYFVLLVELIRLEFERLHLDMDDEKEFFDSLASLKEEDDGDVAAYRQYVENQIFDHYSEISPSEMENYYGGHDLDDEEGFEDDAVGKFDSEAVALDDPRITEDQRAAILEEIAKHGIPIEDVNFDISSEKARDDFYGFNPAIGDRLVFAVTPWGEVISSRFSYDQMKIAAELAKREKKPIDDVILEVMAERYNIANGLD